MKLLPVAGLALLALAGCAGEGARYVVGEPYRMGGVWSYPREETAYAETGLAVRAPARLNARTANGERFTGLAAQHRTLQLPAVVRVTNLENGRSLLLRVNDRGPEQAGRLIGLAPRAAELLGIASGAAAQVRVDLDAERSRAAAGHLPGRPELAGPVTAAPRAAVTTEDLAPPGGARAAPAVAVAARPAVAAPDLGPPPEMPLPEDVTTGVPAPGHLFVEAGRFAGRGAATSQAARLSALGARVEPMRGAGDLSFRVRIGHLGSVAEADSALERTLAAGVSGARILVE
ncbi:MAG TPA: RlpA-like double-psi beta-barrel domain-containing protein [Acetobacteraceae bacterium]|nr:RlpA-like double-psi beta-barrel domain-containing protein [Acetobacteraceae bacterium]